MHSNYQLLRLIIDNPRNETPRLDHSINYFAVFVFIVEMSVLDRPQLGDRILIPLMKLEMTFEGEEIDEKKS